MTPQFEINVTDRPAMLFVGRDPGTTEMRLGRPFVGRAGREVFDPCLREVGIRREDINIANVVGVQPPGNEFRRHKLDDVLEGFDALVDMVRELQPSLIVTMGNEAAWSIITEWPGSGVYQAYGIEDRRGYTWRSNLLGDRPVLATIHPAAVLRTWVPWRTLLANDFRRARFIEGKTLEELRPQREVIVV